MAKQIINVGAAANDKKGDSLRASFQKVNANFTELYTALGLNADTTLNLGAFEFVGSTMSTTDSTAIVIDQATTITSNLTVGGDIVPSIANGGNLGSLAKPFNSLYVSNSTVYFGGIPLSLEAGTNELTINNVPISQTITYADIPGVPTDISDLDDTDGLLGSGNSLTNGSYSFTINNDGSIDLPTLTNLGYEPFYDLNGPTLRLGDPTSQTIITGPTPNSDNPSAQRLVIQGQKGYGNESGAWEGGDIYLWGGVGGEGASGGDGGDIKVRGGAGQNGGGGGYVKVEGGDSQISGDGNGGYVEITGGNSYYGGNGNGGNISVRAGTGNGTGTNGRIEFYTSGFSNQWQFNTDATTKFPNDTLETRPDARLYIDAHDIGEDYAWVAIRNWNDNTEEVNSQVTVRTDGVGISTTGGSVDWSFNPDGSLTVPPNGIIGVPDNTGGTGGYIQFFGAGGEGGDDNTSTSSGNIDIVAGVDGGDENDNIYGELDIGNIRLKTRAYTGQPVKEWKFGWDGSLTFPSGAGFVQGDNGQLKTNDGTTLTLDFRDTSGRGLYTNDDGFSLRGNGTYTWKFDTSGNLTLPSGGDIFASDGVTSVLGGSTGNIGFVTDYIYDFAGVTIENADLTHGATAAVIVPANGTTDPLQVNNFYGAVSITSGISGTTKLWNFNGNGELVLPRFISTPTITTTAGGSIKIQPKIGNVDALTNAGHLYLYAGQADPDHNAAGGSVHILATAKNGGGDGIIDGIVDITTPGGTWTFGSDGAITTSGAFTVETPSSTLIPSNWQGGGGWNQGYYTNKSTTGGTGTGLTVNVAAGGGGYINIGTISINNPGSGYLAGDVITINNENNIPGTFTLVAVPNTWDFGTDGTLTFPDGANYSGKDITLPTTTTGIANKVSWNFADLTIGSSTTSLEWNLLSSTLSDFLIGTSSSATPFYFTFDGTGQTLGAIPNSGVTGGGKLTFGTATKGAAGNADDIELTSTNEVHIKADANIWTFSDDGTLTVPGDIHGAVVMSGGGSPSPVGRTVDITPAPDASDKTFGFRIDQFGETFTRAYLDMPQAEVDKQVAATFAHANGTAGYIFNQGADTNGQGMNNAFNIFYNSGDIKITAMASGSGALKTWKFDPAGALTLPDDAVIQTTNGNISIKAENYLYIDTTDNGQIEIGRNSTGGVVILGQKSTTADVFTDGDLFVEAGVYERFSSLADATGVVTHNCANGHIFYHTSPDANWIVNLTNFNSVVSRATSVTLIITQGGTGYYPSALQIGGDAQNINWLANATPTPSTNRVDVVTFSIICTATDTYTVLGQITGF